MGTIHLAMLRDVLVYCIPSVLAFTVETVQRRATGVQILSLSYWNVFFFSSFCYVRKHALQICFFVRWLCPDCRVLIDGWFGHTHAQLDQMCSWSGGEGFQDLGWASKEYLIETKASGWPQYMLGASYLWINQKQGLWRHKDSGLREHNTDLGLPPMIVILSTPGFSFPINKWG